MVECLAVRAYRRPMTNETPLESSDDVPASGSTGAASRTRASKEFIREGSYAAEVDVELHYFDECWSPCLAPEDVRKLEAVMLALRRGDIAEAAKFGRIYKLTAVST
jgi:hypothetical protein